MSRQEPERAGARAGLVRLERWSGPWEQEDPNANFKADVALHALIDPMQTIEGLAASVGLPVGAIVHYVLARYATSGSAGLLEVGPVMVERLWERVERAEAIGEDVARLAAYYELAEMLSWLRAPIVGAAKGTGAGSVAGDDKGAAAE